MSDILKSTDAVDERHKVPEQAQLALRVISVDKILRSDSVSRELTTSGNLLVAHFQAVSIRQARVALDHFFSDVQLTVQTIDEFDPARESHGNGAPLENQDAAAKEVEVGAT